MWITVELVHNVQTSGTPEKHRSVVKSPELNWSVTEKSLSSNSISSMSFTNVSYRILKN